MPKWTSSVKRGEHLVQFCSSPVQKETAIADLVSCAGEREKVLVLSDSSRLARAVSRCLEKLPDRAGLSCLPVNGVLYDGERFDPSISLESLRKTVESQRKSGQTSMIVVVDMSWLADRPDWFKLYMQVEVSLNLARFRFPVTFVCQYDTASLSMEAAETINSVHALSLVDGKVSRNFWLIPRRGGTFEDMGVVPEESQ